MGMVACESSSGKGGGKWWLLERCSRELIGFVGEWCRVRKSEIGGDPILITTC